jgi:methionine synthase II (cobalamin-independent)
MTTPDFYFKATGIGSVPWEDIDKTCNKVLEFLPAIPFWPQLVMRSPFEDMIIQFTEGLPLININIETRSITVSTENSVEALVDFYSHYLADDIDYFSISRDYAPGLYRQIELVSKNPEKYGEYIKGHITGPVTFAACVKDEEGKSILGNPDLLEAFTKGLAIKGLWQVRELEKTRKKTIIFLDEPYLSGFGSAFSPIGRIEVINLLKEVIEYLKEKSDTLIGIHCCGNTDWSMIVEAGPDIINFDAFSFLDYFLLYPDDIKRFIKGGGTIAWGIVPTGNSAGKGDHDELFLRLNKGLEALYSLGLDRDLVHAASILTPACGMGTMSEKDSDQVLDLLSGLYKRVTQIR